MSDSCYCYCCYQYYTTTPSRLDVCLSDVPDMVLGTFPQLDRIFIKLKKMPEVLMLFIAAFWYKIPLRDAKFRGLPVLPALCEGVGRLSAHPFLHPSINSLRYANDTQSHSTPLPYTDR